MNLTWTTTTTTTLEAHAEGIIYTITKSAGCAKLSATNTSGAVVKLRKDSSVPTISVCCINVERATEQAKREADMHQRRLSREVINS